VVTALERGKVFLNEVECGIPDASKRLVADDVVRVWMDRPGSATRRPGPYKAGALDILFEDDALVVLNKPAGLLSVPLERRSQSPSIVTLLEDYFRSSGKRKPFVVHRIDLDTSGLVVFAKTALAQARLKEQFRRREPERVYWAVVYGHPRPRRARGATARVGHQGTDSERDPPERSRGVDAVSNYSVVERFADTSLIEVRLRQASGTRSASRRACAVTRWSARSATFTAPTRCARWCFRARRCTRGASSSAIRRTIGVSSSRRRCRATWPICSRGSGVA
jgi:23S rRNA pseudouridine1911/1915/1917 synthase